MPRFEYAPTNPNLYDRPRCPECTTQMYLAQIEPGHPGFDLRTFECPKCKHLESVVVEFKKAS